MTPKQFRAARALLDLSLNEAAALAGVAAITVMRFEAGQAVNANSFAALKRVLDSQGVILINPQGDMGEGLRLGPVAAPGQPSKALH
jgi:transcriptional regulator with XRE-family HTH domain